MTGSGGALPRPLLLGLLLVTLFSLGTSGGDASPTTAAAIFWLSALFAQTIIMTALFDLEEPNKTRLGLLLSPMPVQAVWLGKSLAGLGLLLLVQAVLLAASVVFLNSAWEGNPALALCGILLVDVGIVAIGALLAALAGGRTARESLCSLVVFPLLAPQLLAGIRILAALYGEGGTAIEQWLGMAAAFDAVFIAVSLALFPVIYGGEG